MKYQPVIGLEVHVEYKTKTKMFCRCSAEYFGQEPNINTCPVCLGMPGALPVTNKQALDFAVKAGLALNCKINLTSKFDRKHYFYPDLPKGYQISQYDLPVNGMGYLDIDIDGEIRRINITRAHQEEDAGKLIHSGEATLVDLNRAGVPLLEIVSEPEMHSAKEAKAYAQKIQQIIRYTQVSDADMEKGSMRVDANISLRPTGETGLPNYKVEVKNMNTFKGIERAIEFEIIRQAELLDNGKLPAQETRGWNEDKGKTFSQRSKEDAMDYRYFPDPDLPPIVFSQDQIEIIRKSLPELPDAKASRFEAEYGLNTKDVQSLVADRVLAAWYEEAVAVYISSKDKKDPVLQAKTVANWVIGELFRWMNETNTRIEDIKILPAMLAELLYLSDNGKISATTAKDVFAEMFKTGETASHIVQAKGLGQISDEGAITEIVEKILAANEKAVADYKAGKEASLMFLLGQCMKEAKGKANAEQVKELLMRSIS